jgi:hypothetical protein
MVSQVKLYHLASGLRLPGGRRLRGERRLLPESVLPLGRRLPLDGLEYTCCDAWTDFEDEAESRKSNGRLKTSVEVPPPTDLCHFAARGGYTGLENRLYRVEIHAPGSIGTATFKWSRDNGSVVFPIVEFSTETVGKVTLGGVRKDQIPCLQAGDWVEVSDDTSDLRGESGTLLRVAQALYALRVSWLTERTSARAQQRLGPVFF